MNDVMTIRQSTVRSCRRWQNVGPTRLTDGLEHVEANRIAAESPVL
jgi:hypothetical protein